MTLWAIGFLAGTIVTVVVAMLLIGILLQARRILGLAKVASKVVAEIDSNTDPSGLLLPQTRLPRTFLVVPKRSKKTLRRLSARSGVKIRPTLNKRGWCDGPDPGN